MAARRGPNRPEMPPRLLRPGVLPVALGRQRPSPRWPAGPPRGWPRAPGGEWGRWLGPGGSPPAWGGPGSRQRRAPIAGAARRARSRLAHRRWRRQGQRAAAGARVLPGGLPLGGWPVAGCMPWHACMAPPRARQQPPPRARRRQPRDAPASQQHLPPRPPASTATVLGAPTPPCRPPPPGRPRRSREKAAAGRRRRPQAAANCLSCLDRLAGCRGAVACE